MSGITPAQPTQAETIQHSNVGPDTPGHNSLAADNEALTEKPLDTSSTNIPTRSSSKPIVEETSPQVAAQAEPPRRGSKRSILNRSRNPSRSSRRSLRQTKAVDTREPVPPVPQNVNTRSPRKSRTGLMAILNCCGSDRGSDDAKSGEPDLPPKKKQITTSPQRSAARPGEQSEVTEVEKDIESKPVVDEKRAAVPVENDNNVELNEKLPLDVTQPNATSEVPVTPEPSTAVLTNEAALQAQDQIVASPRLSTAHDQVTVSSPDQVPKVVVPDDGTVSDLATDKEVTMHDAPPLPPAEEVLDEPIQPAELQPQVELPPPPPLAKRQEQVIPPQAPAVPEPEIERQQWLLPPLAPALKGRKCLILDLDETLVHSSFKILNQADMTIPVEIEGQYHNVYVIKRPGVDEFMKRVGELYEVVVFTASVSKYGDPLLDQLDIHKVIHHRLFRESCYNHQGNYVKVGRDLKETIIIDNSPTSYIFHPQHAVPISSWFSDAHDNELLDLLPVLEDLAGSQVRDVSLVLDVAL